LEFGDKKAKQKAMMKSQTVTFFVFLSAQAEKRNETVMKKAPKRDMHAVTVVTDDIYRYDMYDRCVLH
jgi:hypothetical protein